MINSGKGLVGCLPHCRTEVSSGQMVGRVYLEKFELTKKRNVAKCVLVEDKWLTLGEFETKSEKRRLKTGESL